MDGLSKELYEFLLKKGADLAGFADLSESTDEKLNVGVSIIKRIPTEVIDSIKDGPTEAYYKNYEELNAQLKGIALAAEEFLKARGFEAYAQIDGSIPETGYCRTAMPHKTVATGAGLGWIGKCALLVTREYGPAVRLSSVLTNAPLETAKPVTASFCGGCTRCQDACPAAAIKGRLWNRGVDRDELVDITLCRPKARSLAFKKIHKEITLCGKCVYVCPYTIHGKESAA